MAIHILYSNFINFQYCRSKSINKPQHRRSHGHRYRRDPQANLNVWRDNIIYHFCMFKSNLPLHISSAGLALVSGVDGGVTGYIIPLGVITNLSCICDENMIRFFEGDKLLFLTGFPQNFQVEISLTDGTFSLIIYFSFNSWNKSINYNM